MGKQLEPEIVFLQAENAVLRAMVGRFERDKSDLEIALETAVEHGDAVESQLEEINRLMQDEISSGLKNSMWPSNRHAMTP